MLAEGKEEWKLTKVIACLGDSITYGYPFTPKESWVALWNVPAGFSTMNFGVNGDTTSDLLHRLPEVMRHKPWSLVLLGGTNDAYLQYHVMDSLNNIKEITSRAREQHIKINIGIPIPALTPFIEKWLASYRVVLIDWASAEGYAIIDFYQAMLDPSTKIPVPEYYVDDVHPSRLGYQAMVTALASLQLSL